MVPIRNALAGCVVALLLVTGCTASPTPVQPSLPTPAPAADAPAPPPEPATAPPPASVPEPGTGAALFPSRDMYVTYSLAPEGSTGPAQVAEEWIRTGDRLVQSINGKPETVWFINDDGVWRQDPAGGGALLRYLPPALKDGLYWKQASGDAEVWFRLEQGGDCLGAYRYDECWALTVLNQEEETHLAFTMGHGPALITQKDPRSPLFTKKRTGTTPSQLTAAKRTELLAAAPTTTGQPAAVVPVSKADFGIAGQGMPVFQGDLDGDGKPEYLYRAEQYLRLESSDGRTLIDQQQWMWAPPRDSHLLRVIWLPDDTPLLHVQTKRGCYKGGADSSFVWYDKAAKQFRVVPEKASCDTYNYVGRDLFDVYSGQGTAVYVRERVRWENGRFVTLSRESNLVPRFLIDVRLGKTLAALASEPVEGGAWAFASLELYQRFRDSAGGGRWTFSEPTWEGDWATFRATKNGEDHGYLRVQTGQATQGLVDPGSLVIVAFEWRP